LASGACVHAGRSLATAEQPLPPAGQRSWGHASTLSCCPWPSAEKCDGPSSRAVMSKSWNAQHRRVPPRDNAPTASCTTPAHRVRSTRQRASATAVRSVPRQLCSLCGGCRVRQGPCRGITQTRSPFPPARQIAGIVREVIGQRDKGAGGKPVGLAEVGRRRRGRGRLGVRRREDDAPMRSGEPRTIPVRHDLAPPVSAPANTRVLGTARGTRSGRYGIGDPPVDDCR
jgi:hypothetical protein